MDRASHPIGPFIRFLILFGFVIYFCNWFVVSGQNISLENASLSDAPNRPASDIEGGNAETADLEVNQQAATMTPDPVKILESFHNLQTETTTNDYNKCERFNRVCCAKILEDIALNRNIPTQDDICRDRGYEECKCAATPVDSGVDTKTLPDPVIAT
ncbi:uncharacterized protein LOC129589334 [Paramacrobiotus metropolitanus]|uniref:uncharacterized protein LOC129589334 n=1 Tax=Paramacrobiotus metropolitanus TaxID=2943436 RepID=UPI0024457157|nr:uncharacterized protein LOC129589334 [Paramacrobiotus metropolitanus]